MNKKNVVTGIAEFESAAAAASAIEAMNANGPRKIMTKDDQDIISLQQVIYGDRTPCRRYSHVTLIWSRW